MSDNANNTGGLNLSKDMYSLRIKSTINALQTMNFEAFLKKHIETAPEVSLFDIFRNAVFDVVFATEAHTPLILIFNLMQKTLKK